MSIRPRDLPELRKSTIQTLPPPLQIIWGHFSDTELIYARSDFTHLINEMDAGGVVADEFLELTERFRSDAVSTYLYLAEPRIIEDEAGAVAARIIIWTREAGCIRIRAIGAHECDGEEVPLLLASLPEAPGDNVGDGAWGSAHLLVNTVAMWSLLSMEGLIDASIETIRSRSSNTKRRKAAGKPCSVKVVDLRRSVSENLADVERARAARLHRWIVRGHWRSQPYGPNRTLRRRVYIAPHIKGPSGAPLLDRPTVFRW